MVAVWSAAVLLESYCHRKRSTSLPGAMNADKLIKACGSLTPIHPRSKLKVFLSKTYCIDGETATQSIKAGYTMDHYERFIDSHEGQVVCYDGYAGLEWAFKEWVKENSS